MGNDKTQPNALMAKFLGPEPEAPNPFIGDTLDALIERFGIKPNQRGVVESLLYDSFRIYWRAQHQQRRDLASIQKQLDRVTKAAQKLAECLNDLDQPTQETLSGSQYWRDMDRHLPNAAFIGEQPIPELLKSIPEHPAGGAPLDLEEISRRVLALSQIAQNTKPFAGSNAVGRRSDDSLTDFLLLVFLLWTKVLQREFKLDWYNKTEPLTEAAAFCRDISIAVDPDIKLTKVVGAARTVREMSKGTSNLQDMPQLLAHYLKPYR